MAIERLLRYIVTLAVFGLLDNSCSVNDTEGSTKTSACEELSIQAKTTAERKMLLANVFVLN